MPHVARVKEAFLNWCFLAVIVTFLLTRVHSHTPLSQMTHTHTHTHHSHRQHTNTKRHPLGYARTFCLFRRVGITITKEWQTQYNAHLQTHARTWTRRQYTRMQIKERVNTHRRTYSCYFALSRLRRCDFSWTPRWGARWSRLAFYCSRDNETVLESSTHLAACVLAPWLDNGS